MKDVGAGLTSLQFQHSTGLVIVLVNSYGGANAAAFKPTIRVCQKYPHAFGQIDAWI